MNSTRAVGPASAVVSTPSIAGPINGRWRATRTATTNTTNAARPVNTGPTTLRHATRPRVSGIGPEANDPTVQVAATRSPSTVNHAEPRGTRKVAPSSAVPARIVAVATTRRRCRTPGSSTVAGALDGTRISGTRTDLGGRSTLHPCRQGLGCRVRERHRRVAEQLVEPTVAHHDLVRQ